MIAKQKQLRETLSEHQLSYFLEEADSLKEIQKKIDDYKEPEPTSQDDFEKRIKANQEEYAAIKEYQNARDALTSRDKIQQNRKDATDTISSIDAQIGKLDEKLKSRKTDTGLSEGILSSYDEIYEIIEASEDTELSDIVNELKNKQTSLKEKRNKNNQELGALKAYVQATKDIANFKYDENAPLTPETIKQFEKLKETRLQARENLRTKTDLGKKLFADKELIEAVQEYDDPSVIKRQQQEIRKNTTKKIQSQIASRIKNLGAEN